jgi:hypothetical protein
MRTAFPGRARTAQLPDPSRPPVPESLGADGP